MANHCLDCEYCGRDRRVYSHCCNRAVKEDEARRASQRKFENDLASYKRKFCISSETDLLNILKQLYEVRETLPAPIKEKILKRELSIQKRKECSKNKHRYPDGKSAIKAEGGFMFTKYTCKLCGFSECDL